ncbi:hypothetical protein ACIQYS_14435 [Psychrobacillus sp. NPDC096426]|uniref:hypothetical protein n=1 Tax=Psychrobacillus sp. NPDC096426 TaxID=3364491 RepID=UPI00380342AA
MRFVNLQNMDEATKNKYFAAYNALNELMKVESGIDLVGRCYSDVIHKERENIFMQRMGVKKTKGVASAKRLVGKRGNIDLLIDKVPGSDHSNLWIKDGKPYSFTIEPYTLGKKTLEELIDYCGENGLDFNISNHSFHNPAGTFLVEIKKSHNPKFGSEKE